MNRITAFDPDKYLPSAAPAGTEPLFRTPKAWAHGLAMLAEREVPRNADPVRWAQVIADATKIATIWSELATWSGWSLTNLFGFDLESNRVGLAVALEGRALVDMNETFATIKKPDGLIWHHADMAPDSPLLWTFDEQKLRL